MTSTIVIHSLPPKTFIGLDLLSFNSSPNFRGISKIPLDCHFLYTGTDATLSIRHGTWLNLKSGSAIHNLQWSSKNECLESSDKDGEVESTIESPAVQRGLIDYEALQSATSDLVQKQAESEKAAQSQTTSEDEEPAESTDWPSLTSHILPSLLTRVLGAEWHVSSVSSAPDDTENIPGLSHLEASNVLDQLPLNLTPVNLKQTWAADDIGRTRTDRARDRSWYLSHVIETLSQGKDRAFGARELVGELQFCFLLVLTLANYSCLEQWKRLLAVILTCQTALNEVEAFFLEVIKVLHLQIKHVEDVEGGLFDLRDEHASSWLRSLWAQFRATVEEGEVGEREALRKEVGHLQKLFEDKYGWQSERDILKRGMVELEDGERVEVELDGVDEDEETGEYAPVIVET